ncbi:MAG: PDZ domain-containing protein [Solitalea sp.]
MLTGFSVRADELRLSYALSFEEAQAHYVDVVLSVSGLEREYVDLKMAVWAPGSYLIREFPKNVEGFKAQSGEKTLNSRKISKNTWRVDTKGAGDITVQYRVYAFEMSVRTSFVDADHAFLNGTSIFMYLDQELDLPSTIKITPHPDWKYVSTGLKSDPEDPFLLYSPNYDILADSPIEIGNQDIIEFTAAGIPHEVAIFGGGDYDKAKVIADFTRIIEEQTAIFGTNPCERYVFIVHFLASGGGGLEHLNSTTLQFPRRSLGTEAGWASFMGLVAHEYFHLWNVKRLRPAALGPFNYEAENYTNMLWVSEGFTAYYDDWTVRRTGFYSPEEYLQTVAGVIGTIENTPGNRVQPVAEASFDAWIKYYRPNENSYNTTISYYSKGAILGMLIDMSIRKHSQGKHSLDDLMRYLYERYYEELDRGYRDEEFKEAVEKFAGNMDDFFDKYVYGTEPIPYNRFFDAVGLKLVTTRPWADEAYLGASFQETGNGLVVTRVVRGTAAYQYGLNVNDLLLTVNGERVNGADDVLKGKKPGDRLSLQVIRNGLPRTIQLILGKNDNISVKFEKLDNPSSLQEANYKAWMGL